MNGVVYFSLLSYYVLIIRVIPEKSAWMNDVLSMTSQECSIALDIVPEITKLLLLVEQRTGRANKREGRVVILAIMKYLAIAQHTQISTLHHSRHTSTTRFNNSSCNTYLAVFLTNLRGVGLLFREDSEKNKRRV